MAKILNYGVLTLELTQAEGDALKILLGNMSTNDYKKFLNDSKGNWF